MESVLDRDGRVLNVRDVGPDDLEAVEDLLGHLSPRSARQRFLSTSTQAGPHYVDGLADPARTLDAVVVEAGSRIVGVGSTHPLPEAATVEFAVVVDDEDQGHGIGTVIVEALVSRARARGVRTMVGTVLGANAQMFDLLGHLGLSYQSVLEEGTADVTLTISPGPAFASAHLARAEEARAAAVRPLLVPSGVAVLAPSSASRAWAAVFAGRPEVPVWPIQRTRGGYDVPQGVELALVPGWLSEAGPAAVACAEAGVPAIALLARGGTATEEGDTVLEQVVLDRIRAAGARVLGPGSRCLVNTDPLVRLHAGTTPARVSGGVVGVVTDDAPCLDPLQAQLVSRGLGVSTMVDVGSTVDLGVSEVVAWLAQDARTELVVVALRGPADDDLLAQLGRVHATHKPVLLLTTESRDMEGPAPGFHEGPVRATSLGGLADLAMVFVLAGQPPGRRVVILTNEPRAVGAGAKQEYARGGLLGPYLTQHSDMRIHFLAPGATTGGAVLTLPAEATGAQVHDVLETLTDDPGVDAVVIDLAPSPSLRPQSLWPLLREVVRTRPRRRPAPVIVAVDRRGSRYHGSLPVFGSVSDALDAVARTCARRSA
jgi:succinyl-CoA synthetase alpha subunit/GNAT superfamily N-acetyltransferase